MPRLIIDISASLLDNFETEISLVRSIVGTIESEISNCGDYNEVFGMMTITQNWSSLDTSEGLTKPLFFGLKQRDNFTTIEISY